MWTYRQWQDHHPLRPIERDGPTDPQCDNRGGPDRGGHGKPSYIGGYVAIFLTSILIQAIPAALEIPCGGLLATAMVAIGTVLLLQGIYMALFLASYKITFPRLLELVSGSGIGFLAGFFAITFGLRIGMYYHRYEGCSSCQPTVGADPPSIRLLPVARPYPQDRWGRQLATGYDGCPANTEQAHAGRRYGPEN